MIEGEGRVREQQACIWAANNNSPWCGALLHWTPFAADHLLENALLANDGSPVTRADTVGCWPSAASREPATLENRLCSECRRFAFPKACVSICDCDGAGN
jgi:hypothetical protein